MYVFIYLSLSLKLCFHIEHFLNCGQSQQKSPVFHASAPSLHIQSKLTFSVNMPYGFVYYKFATASNSLSPAWQYHNQLALFTLYQSHSSVWL